MKPNSWQMQDGDTVLATVKQVPLRCAWAITIHKSRLESAQAADTLASDGVGAFRARMPQPAGEDDEFAQDVLF